VHRIETKRILQFGRYNIYLKHWEASFTRSINFILLAIGYIRSDQHTFFRQNFRHSFQKTVRHIVFQCSFGLRLSSKYYKN
jgi:hypothetical protein